VFSFATMGNGIGKWADRLGDFENRTRPAMAQQDRRVLTPEAYVKEVDPQATIHLP
jgi:hypothetical protein